MATAIYRQPLEQAESCSLFSSESCPTLCDPIDCMQPARSMGFLRQEYWSRQPFPSPEDLPDPEIEPAFHDQTPACSPLIKLWGLAWALLHLEGKALQKVSPLVKLWAFWANVCPKRSLSKQHKYVASEDPNDKSNQGKEAGKGISLRMQPFDIALQYRPLGGEANAESTGFLVSQACGPRSLMQPPGVSVYFCSQFFCISWVACRTQRS